MKRVQRGRWRCSRPSTVRRGIVVCRRATLIKESRRFVDSELSTADAVLGNLNRPNGLDQKQLRWMFQCTGTRKKSEHIKVSLDASRAELQLMSQSHPDFSAFLCTGHLSKLFLILHEYYVK